MIAGAARPRDGYSVVSVPQVPKHGSRATHSADYASSQPIVVAYSRGRSPTTTVASNSSDLAMRGVNPPWATAVAVSFAWRRLVSMSR